MKYNITNGKSLYEMFQIHQIYLYIWDNINDLVWMKGKDKIQKDDKIGFPAICTII